MLPLPQLQVSQQSQQVRGTLRTPRLLRALPPRLNPQTGNTTKVRHVPTLTLSTQIDHTRHKSSKMNILQITQLS